MPNKAQRIAMGIGGSLLLLALLRIRWLQTRVPLTRWSLAEVRLWFWLPPGAPDGLVVLSLSLGVVLMGWAAVQYARHKRRAAPRGRPSRRPAARRPRPPVVAGPSAFAIDPWTDTGPTALDTANLSPARQLEMLHHLARQMEHQGRLRAAREAYRQAYNLAQATPELAHYSRPLLMALRKVEKRLEQQARASAGSPQE